MSVWKYLNETVRRIGEQNRKSFEGFSKTKKKNKHRKRLNFKTSFRIEVLLPFTSCRKMLEKMPAQSWFNLQLICKIMGQV